MRMTQKLRFHRSMTLFAALLMLSTLFISVISSAGIASAAVTAEKSYSIISTEVETVAKRKNYFMFLRACFDQVDIDKVTDSEVDNWDFFEGAGNNDKWQIGGNIFGPAEDATWSCQTESVTATAFESLGFTNSKKFFCELSGSYVTATENVNEDSHDDDKCFDPGNWKPGENYQWDNDDSNTKVRESFEKLVKEKNGDVEGSGTYPAAAGALPDYAEYLRLYLSFMAQCGTADSTVEVTADPYVAGSADPGDKYELPVVTIETLKNTDTSKLWKSVLASGQSSTSAQVAIEARIGDNDTPYKYGDKDSDNVTDTEYPKGEVISCNDAVSRMRGGLAQKYAEYLNTHPSALESVSSIPGANNNSSADNSADQCDIALSSALNWIVCPLVDLMQTSLEIMDKIIRALMFTPIEQVFTDNTKKSAVIFRNLALGIIVIAGLFMVISQAAGLQILDAYTIKKVFPRLLIAGIGVAVSYPLLLFVVTIFNDLGIWGHDIVIQAFGTTGSGSWQSVMNALIVNGAVAAGAFIYGPAMLTFLGTALLAMLIGVVVLSIRQLIIIIAVLMAPIAIACYILPGTQKIWNFWQNALMTALIAFPIITMFLAAGKGLSSVLNGTTGTPILHIMALFVYIAPYFLLPFAFKLAGGLMSTVFSMANDSSRGGFDRLRNVRGNAAASRHKDRMEGNSAFGTGRTGRAYRRVATGNFGATARQRRNFGANERIIANRSAAAALEADGGRAVGNDDATALAVQKGMTADRFIQEYQRNTGQSKQQAKTALGELESGLGARIGTSTMQVSAFKARAASSTAFDGSAEGTAQRINEGAALINQGLITSADATAAGKGNRARLDISGNGFGAQMTTFDAAAASLEAGRGGMDVAGAEAYLDQTLGSAEPGDLLAGNNRTVEAMAPRMTARLTRSIQARDAAIAAVDIHTAAGNPELAEQARAAIAEHEIAIDRSLGQIAGVQDNLNRTSPDKAAIFADLVMSTDVSRDGGATVTTIRKAIADASTRAEEPGGSQAFLEVRKEYGSAVPRGSISEAEAAAIRQREQESGH